MQTEANHAVVGILLAAGESSRMGTAKQLLDIDGEPLIVHTVRKLLAVNIELITVLGARFEQIKPVLNKFPTSVIYNRNYRDGMGTSLVAALKYLDKQQVRPTAILLSVCDQPYLTTDLLQILLEKHYATPTRIITAHYGENFGVPAILPRRFFPELLTLQADKGAKKIMLRHPTELTFVDFPTGDFDLDTPDDYATFTG